MAFFGHPSFDGRHVFKNLNPRVRTESPFTGRLIEWEFVLPFYPYGPWVGYGGFYGPYGYGGFGGFSPFY